MNAPRTFDDQVAAWLDDGPEQAPVDLLDFVLSDVDGLPQARGLHDLLPRPYVSRPLAAVLLLVVLALLVGWVVISSQPKPPRPGPIGRVAIVAGRGIEVIDGDGSHPHELASWRVAAEPQAVAFSPDGGRLAYIRLTRQGALRIDPRDGGVVVIDAQSGDKLSDTNLPNASSVRWSPDGRSVFVDAWTGTPNSPATDSWSVELDTKTVRKLTETVDGPAVWSPNGKWLLVPGHSDLYVIPTGVVGLTPIGDPSSVPGARRLTTGADPEFADMWSPDSESVLLTAPRFVEKEPRPNQGSPIQAFGHDESHVDAVDIETGSRHVLADQGCAGTWSPDGRSIAYLAGQRGDRNGFDLWVASADGTNRRRIGKSWSGTRWSPDGRYVLADRSDGLFAVSANGSGQAIRLTQPGSLRDERQVEHDTVEALCGGAGHLMLADWGPMPGAP